MRGDRRRAGIEQSETAGAVSGFDHARREAGLADQGGLLVAGDAVDRDRGAEQFRIGHAERGGAIQHRRQNRFGHAEQRQQPIVPAAFMDVEQQRARRIGGVGGVHFAAGEPPQQIRIDRAECQLTARGPFANVRRAIQQPGEFCAGEIRIEQKPGLPRELGFMAGGLQARTKIRRAPVLPDDGAMHRAAAGAVPQQRGLALVGDADGDDVARAGAGLLHGAAATFDRRRPQIFRLVLDLAVGGKVLREFLLRESRDRGVGPEQAGPGRGRALVDAQDVRCHPRLPADARASQYNDLPAS